MTSAIIPTCVGTFQPSDKQCDGDPRGKTQDERAPCAWRSRCAGLQIHCLEMEVAPPTVVGQLAVPALIQLCERYVTDRRIVNGRPSSEEDPAPLPPKKSEAKPVKRLRTRSPIAPDVMELHTHFVEQLRSNFPGRRIATGKRLLVYAGTLYPIDRRKRSHYIAWYCSTTQGYDKAVAMVIFHPRFRNVDIALPVWPEAVSDLLNIRAAKKLHVAPWNNGQFKSICAKLDREGIGLCAETIRKLVDTEVIKLPGAHR